MDEVNVVFLVSRWFHIAAAIVAIGGAVFMRVALLPGAQSTLDEEAHRRLRDAVRKRWAPFVHACIAILLITGSINFVILAWPPEVDPMPYHPIFGLKVLAALAIFVVATALVGRSAGFAPVRERSGRWLSIVLILAALVILLSGVLSQIRAAGVQKLSESQEVVAASEPRTMHTSMSIQRVSRARWSGATICMAGCPARSAKPMAHATNQTVAQAV